LFAHSLLLRWRSLGRERISSSLIAADDKLRLGRKKSDKKEEEEEDGGEANAGFFWRAEMASSARGGSCSAPFEKVAEEKNKARGIGIDWPRATCTVALGRLAKPEEQGWRRRRRWRRRQ